MLGLLEAILSQTRRALTKILRLDTDYTTTRAGYMDNLPDLDATVSSRLADSNAVARVQTGLTNQGYTAGRAPNLDNLDASVSSRLSDSAAQGKVTSGLTAQGYTTSRAGYLDQIEQSNLRSNVQAGLNNNGYNSTRAGKLDYLNASISTRAPNRNTRAQIVVSTGGGATTLWSTTGKTILHGITHYEGFVNQVRVDIDGTTVSTLIPGSSARHTLASDGQTYDVGSSNYGPPPGIQWESKSSLDIVAPYGNTGARFTYSKE